MPTIQTKLGPIYVDVAGEPNAPTALLWPSLFNDHTMWEAQTSALQGAGWRTLAIDPPGQGMSPGQGRDFTMDECAEVVVQVLDALAEDRPALLIGSSWGGMVAPRVAVMAPNRVSGMVLFNTTAERPAFQTLMVAKLLTVLLRIKPLDRTVDNIIVASNLTEATRANRPEVAQNLVRRFRSWDRSRLIMTVRSVLVDRDDTLGRLKAVGVPTIVVSGSEDTVLPTPYARRIAERIAGAKQIEIPGCAHLVPIEAPDAANGLIMEVAGKIAA